MYDLARLSLQDVTEIGIALRSLGKNSDSLETVANRCVQYFYQNLIDPITGQSACTLVRLFKTHAYADLPAELQRCETRLDDADPSNELKCLTLLGTAGDQAEWQDRRQSTGHQVIPLTNEEAIRQIPMISQLITSFGFKTRYVLAPDPELLTELTQKTCNVFYVPKALGSPFIPAQSEFVEPFGVQSVLGFGGMLPSGNLFAVILFSKVSIPKSTAQLFKTLPLNIKMSILPFDKKQIFQVLQSA
jgi:hypothetical protein